MQRGTVVIHAERCKGCALCVDVCPPKVLSPDGPVNPSGYRTVSLTENQATCTGCGLCALVCPDVVFTVYRLDVPAAVHRMQVTAERSGA